MTPTRLWSPLDIARAEEPRQARSTAEVAREHASLGGGTACYDSPGSWANQACALGLDGPVPEAELDALVAFYVSRGAEPKVELCPFADKSVIRGLAARGFAVQEFENVLARPLTSLREGDLGPGDPAEGLEISLVSPADDATLCLAAEVASSGFRPEGLPMTDDELALALRVARHPRSHTFLALIDGEPAGAASMEVDGELAVLFGATVLPPFRRRGVQQALIGARLAHGLARGAALGVIHSRPGIPTERNAIRLGFQVAYTKVLLSQRP